MAGRQMIKQGKGGRLIGAPSVSGKRGFPMLSTYSANKFFVRGITQAAAIEFGSHGITVNSYAPGLIETDMMREMVDQLNGKSSWVAKCASATAVKRNGYPEDIAHLVSYLASEQSGFVTGQSINANEGYVAYD
ncbi:hypothetical protein M422DRAFT_68987 [Sphaerobolus stellatus SS14]|uniref:Uncharacterized protein n=1 Tax=Sphaerobolus stellatus (strain SS14) TaxID=990650 RepID=A0A0C9UV11_SPHS4|nr:hypothetical protein M422DRAFT_68987 [Sphaerobolus stellatus SS14]